MTGQAAPSKKQGKKQGWWMPPLVATTLMLVGLVVFLVANGLASMAFDSCDGSSYPCPQANSHIANGGYLCLSACIALLIQWPVSYWIPRYARYFVAFVPPLLITIAVIVVLTTPVGR